MKEISVLEQNIVNVFLLILNISYSIKWQQHA